MIVIKNKVILSWIFLALYAVFIFCMSGMDTYESNGKSKELISTVIEKTVKITNKLKITNYQLDKDQIKRLTNKLNKPLRKFAHASEYLIFTIIVIIALTCSGINGRKVYFIALLLCFIYAGFDEYHQTFVSGRTGQFKDVMIDILGGFCGCLIIMLKNKIIKKKKI